MSREGVAKTVKEAYEKGYYEGFKDACDSVPIYLNEFIGNLMSTLKESAEKVEFEAFDMEENNEN